MSFEVTPEMEIKNLKSQLQCALRALHQIAKGEKPPEFGNLTIKHVTCNGVDELTPEGWSWDRSQAAKAESDIHPLCLMVAKAMTDELVRVPRANDYEFVAHARLNEDKTLQLYSARLTALKPEYIQTQGICLVASSTKPDATTAEILNGRVLDCTKCSMKSDTFGCCGGAEYPVGAADRFGPTAEGCCCDVTVTQRCHNCPHISPRRPVGID